MRITDVHRTLHEGWVNTTLLAICLILRGNLESPVWQGCKILYVQAKPINNAREAPEGKPPFVQRHILHVLSQFCQPLFHRREVKTLKHISLAAAAKLP